MNPAIPNVKIAAPFKKPGQSPWVTMALLIIVIVCFVWFMLLPLSQNVDKARTQLHAVEATNQTLTQTNQDLQKLVSRMQSVPQDISQLNEALPLDSGQTKLDVLLDSLANASGMTLSSIQLDTKGTGGTSVIVSGDKQLLQQPFSSVRKLHTVGIQTTVTGNLDQFLNFLQLVETNRRVIDIDSISVKSEQVNVLSFHLQLKTYYYAP